MAKAARTLCDRCESRIVVGEPFCGSCGHPTSWATLDERASWEVAQYREKRVSAPIRAPLEDAPRLRAASRVDLANRPPGRDKKAFGLFSRRRQPAPALVIPEPKRVEPAPAIEESPAPAAVLTMVRPEPAPAPAKPSPRARAPKVEQASANPASEPLATKVERAMDENERVVDTPATVLAMRMLNQRVRELDEKVKKLERELTSRAVVPAAETAKPRKRFW